MLRFETHWLGLHLQGLVCLVWVCRWTWTSFRCPRKRWPGLGQLTYTSCSLPKDTESRKINGFFQATRFCAVLLFSKARNRDMISSDTMQPGWDRDDTRNQLFQPPMLSIRVHPYPPNDVQGCLIHFHSL